MEKFKAIFASIFFTQRFFVVTLILSASFALSHYAKWLEIPVTLVFLVFFLLLVYDFFILFRTTMPETTRSHADRFSLNCPNEIHLQIKNLSARKFNIHISDALPQQLNSPDYSVTRKLNAFENVSIAYNLIPKKRGQYVFGNTLVFLQTPLRLIERKIIFENQSDAKVYPAFALLRNYDMLLNQNNFESGNNLKKALGRFTEFEQIKEYAFGDDIRAINWHASAKKGALMVNQYREERAKQVYTIVDKGRNMKTFFDSMTYLDYAVNASLALSYAVLNKYDKIGIITISENRIQHLQAKSGRSYMAAVMEFLYRQKTRYLESNIELLYTYLRKKVSNRSLLVYFTNYESIASAERHNILFKNIAKNHLLLVVIFENTELKELAAKPADNLESIYIKTIAQDFVYEKKNIIQYFNRNGILCLSCKPASLSMEVIKKYVEIKQNGLF